MDKNRYVDLLVDFSFKKIFGTDTNKAVLIDLLNTIFEGRKVIIDLVYNKNEHHGENQEEGTAIFDLLCTGDKGEKFLIEVQHSKPSNFKKRSIFYTSRLISEQAPKGKMKEWAYNISEVYFVAIMDQNEFYNIAEYTKLSKEEQDMYDEALKRKWDNVAVMTEARESGEARGRAEGERNKALEIARKMKADGQPFELILKFTELSAEEIEKL